MGVCVVRVCMCVYGSCGVYKSVGLWDNINVCVYEWVGWVG